MLLIGFPPAACCAVPGLVPLLLADVAHNGWTLQSLMSNLTTHVAAYVGAFGIHVPIQAALTAFVVDAHGVTWPTLVVQATTVTAGLAALACSMPEAPAVTAFGYLATLFVMATLATATADMRSASCITLVRAVSCRC